MATGRSVLQKIKSGVNALSLDGDLSPSTRADVARQKTCAWGEAADAWDSVDKKLDALLEVLEGLNDEVEKAQTVENDAEVG